MNLRIERLSAYDPLYLSYRMKQDLQPYYQGEVYDLYRRLMQLRNTSYLVRYILSYMYLQ